MALRCPSCQAPLLDRARFCLECGSATNLPLRSDDPAVFPVVGPDSTCDCLLELRPGERFQPWELRRPYYSVGREGTKILLTDPRVSRRHLAVVRVGTDWLVINLSDKRLRVNGWEVGQKTLRSGDVLRIGHTWLVFCPGTQSRPSAPLRPMAGGGQGTEAPTGTVP